MQRVKIHDDEANVVEERDDSQAPNWEKCFSIEVVDQEMKNLVVHKTDTVAQTNSLIDYNKEWILDSGCSHHATGNIMLLLSSVRPHLCNK